MFKQLKGINSEKKVQKREETTLEQLLSFGEEVIKDPEIKEFEGWGEEERDYLQEKVNELNTQYDEKDIVDVIRAGTYIEDNQAKKTFGTYTGCLLTKLTRERHAIGETTKIHVKDVEADYILYGAQEADEIIIEGCEGEYIGGYIGSHKGHVDTTIIQNCEGNYIGYDIGSFGGHAKTIIINNCTGDYIGDIGSFGGHAEKTIINNCKGKSIIMGIGSDERHAKTTIIQNCTGDYIGVWIGKDRGRADTTIINNPVEIEKQGFKPLIELINSMTSDNILAISEEVYSWVS